MNARRTPRPLSFEDAIQRVLEQDGLTMATPEGIRRRAKRMRNRRYARTTPSIFFDVETTAVGSDPILEIDTAHVQSLHREPEPDQGVTIRVSEGELESPHVLSLKEVKTVTVRPRRELETYRVREGADFSAEYASPDVFGTLAHDLVLDQYDPYWIADQFTHHEFYGAYRAVYGSVRRARSRVSRVSQIVSSWTHRLERVEAQVVNEVEDVVTYVDIPRLRPLRALGGFMALALFVTMPAQALVAYRSASYTRTAAEDAGREAVQELLSLRDPLDAAALQDSLRRASGRFRDADALLADSGALAVGLAAVVPERYRAGRALLEVGDKTAEAGRLFTRGIEKMFSDPERTLDERFDLLAAYAEGVVPLVRDASEAADTVDPSALPEAQRESFVSLRAQLAQAETAFLEIAELATQLAGFLGQDRVRTYLLVFQNHTELRPTGGFMGSVAEVSVDRGSLKKMFVPPGGTYDLQGQLTKIVEAPKPLHLINARWEFQDTNWSPDFPTSAKTINAFWSDAGQPTLDGIVAVNASLVEDLLDITGPIELPEYGKTITSENFLKETQTEVEINYDREANTPKKFIGDLGEKLLKRVATLSKDEWLRVAGLLSEGLTTKEVQVYFADADEEAFAERLGWNGRLKDTDGDALALIEANIAGQKTDGVIEERVRHVAEIQSDGSIQDIVTLTRTHTGVKGDLFSGVRNVSYLRAYVPRGSRLLAAEGFERPPAELFESAEEYFETDDSIRASEATMVTHPSGADVFLDDGYTVFGGWMQLDPGKTQTITLRYALPFTINELTRAIQDSVQDESADSERAYLLLLTSQSGREREIVSEIRYPDSWDMTWSKGVIPRPASAVFEGVWDRDHVSAGLFKTHATKN